LLNFDILYAFLPPTVAKLSTFKNSPVFLAHPVLVHVDYVCVIVYVVSSHWYLAIICFPYLVGVKETLTAPSAVTAKQQLKQVVTSLISVLSCCVKGGHALRRRQGAHLCTLAFEPVGI